MTPARELLADLTRLGVELRADGETLRYRPVELMTLDLRGRVETHRLALLAILRGQPEPPPEYPHADAEWRRFLAVCRPWPDGRGWFDPRYHAVLELMAGA